MSGEQMMIICQGAFGGARGSFHGQKVDGGQQVNTI